MDDMTQDQKAARLRELQTNLVNRTADKVRAEMQLDKARAEMDKALTYMVYHNKPKKSARSEIEDSLPRA